MVSSWCSEQSRAERESSMMNSTSEMIINLNLRSLNAKPHTHKNRISATSFLFVILIMNIKFIPFSLSRSLIAVQCCTMFAFLCYLRVNVNIAELGTTLYGYVEVDLEIDFCRNNNCNAAAARVVYT
jgi:hypothetical protein